MEGRGETGSRTEREPAQEAQRRPTEATARRRCGCPYSCGAKGARPRAPWEENADEEERERLTANPAAFDHNQPGPPAGFFHALALCIP
jgi:hypothetical protein